MRRPWRQHDLTFWQWLGWWAIGVLPTVLQVAVSAIFLWGLFDLLRRLVMAFS